MLKMYGFPGDGRHKASASNASLELRLHLPEKLPPARD